MNGRFDVTGRTCLVTGAARGIGQATVEAFASAGARVVVADVDEAAAKTVADGIVSAGGQACAVAIDVGAATSVETSVAQAARFGSGRLDVLINNAGVNVVKATDAITLEEWERVVRVNLTGVFLCSQAAARVMRAHGGGRIVNVASIYGLVGPALHAASPYAATKSGVVGLTRALAVEWRPPASASTPSPPRTCVRR